MIRITVFAVLLSIGFSAANAQEKTEKVPVDTVSIGNINPVVTAIRCMSGEIIIDGKPDEPVWTKAGVCRNFVEISPGDNSRCEVETQMLVAYDNDNLYLAFICYENDVSRIRANMCDRDKIWNDDYVGVILDTYHENKQGIELFCNPLGLQGDATWTPNEENDSYDLVFQSAGYMYNDRWTVEMAIPFKSIRFPEKPVQEWGLHVIRTRPREDRTQMSWAVVSRDNPSLFRQAGVLKGIMNVKNGKNLDILPYVIGSERGFINDIENPNSGFTNEKVKGDFGIGVKYGFTSNLTGEMVYNPDFSQVESDAAQVDVNTASALFYAEKRPFFLEGKSYFNTSENLAYTRMINKPLFAAKLLGKLGGLDIGYIGAYDQKTQFILPYDYGSNIVVFDSLKSLSNMLRVRKSLKGDSYLGMLATDREVKGGYSRVLSFDGSINFKDYYYLSWQINGYSTKEINDTTLYSDNTKVAGKYDLTFNGEKLNGIGGMLEINRQTRNWYADLIYTDSPPEERRDLGFINYVNYRQFSTDQSFYIFPKKGILVKVVPSVMAYMKYKYDGSVKERVCMPSVFFQFKKLIDVTGTFLAANDEDYKDVMLRGVHRGWITFNINSLNEIKGGGTLEMGKYIVRFGEPMVGYGMNLSLWMDLRLFGRLLMENTYEYSELSTSFKGQKLYAGYIIRDKATLQFNKNLFLRVVTQYDTFDKILEIDPLISYKWNPFTIFYIGSTHTLNEFSNPNSSTHFVNTSRQFFAKFQYLFRL